MSIWQHYSNQSLVMEDGVVHVWRLFLPTFFSKKVEMQRVVSEQEQVTAERFVKSSDGDNYLISKVFQRVILSRYLGVCPASIQFSKGKYGKPFLIDNNGWQFNLSHSGDFALLGVSKNAQVGVDVEQMDRCADPMALAQRFFSPEENSQLNLLKAGERADAFYRCWVKKEAFIKAVGFGLSFPLEEFTVDIEASHPTVPVLHNNVLSCSKWEIVPVIMENKMSYQAAVAVEESFRNLVLWDCDFL